MIELLEQANLVVREADKLRDTIRAMERGDDDTDDGIDPGTKPDGRVLWQKPSLGLTPEIVAQKQKNATRNQHRWHSLSFDEDPKRGRVLRHKKRKGEVIDPLGYAHEEVVIKGAQSVSWHLDYKPIVNCGHPGKHMSCSLNGGYRGSGHASHGWSKLGGTANLMHPAMGKENGLGLFIAHRGMDSRHGENYYPRSEPLVEGRWYDIEVKAHLDTRQWELRVNGNRVSITPNLPHLLFDKGQDYERAHAFIRFMHGGHPPSLIPEWDAEEVWGDIAISVVQ